MKICPLLAITRSEDNECMGAECAWCIHRDGDPKPLDMCAIAIIASIPKVPVST